MSKDEVLRIADDLHGFNHQLTHKAAAELRRLHDVNQELLQACQTFAEWLRREEEGFDLETHSRQTPEGEAAWRKWFYENLDICDLAQKQARAAIAKAGETK